MSSFGATHYLLSIIVVMVCETVSEFINSDGYFKSCESFLDMFALYLLVLPVHLFCIHSYHFYLRLNHVCFMSLAV